MFEKDAGEYADLKCGKENRKTTGWVLTQDDFQKGAEFGYNKANEWHDLKTKRPQLRKEVLWLIDNQLWLGELLESRIDFSEWELDSVLYGKKKGRW